MIKIEKIVWSIIIFLVSITAIALYFTKDISDNEDRIMVIEQSKIIDSLKQEIFAKDIEIGRYEITIDLLKVEDSAAAEKFTYILENETE